MTDLQTRTVDPKMCVVSFGGVLFSGYADGTYITITRSGNMFEKRKGADGSIDRINTNAKDYSIQITLMQTSPTNDALSALMITDQESNLGVLPLSIQDLSGTTVFFAAQAWIEKDPDDEFSDSLGTRQWTFSTGIAQKFTGGNT